MPVLIPSCSTNTFSGLVKPTGAFLDEHGTKTPWRAKIRRIRATLYRRVSTRALTLPEDQEPILKDVVKRFQAALEVAGIGSTELDLAGFQKWLIPWFNPQPSLTGVEPRRFIELATQVSDSRTFHL